jgi:CRP-like cAMP-binding protein
MLNHPVALAPGGYAVHPKRSPFGKDEDFQPPHSNAKLASGSAPPFGVEADERMPAAKPVRGKKKHLYKSTQDILDWNPVSPIESKLPPTTPSIRLTPSQRDAMARRRKGGTAAGQPVPGPGTMTPTQSQDSATHTKRGKPRSGGSPSSISDVLGRVPIFRGLTRRERMELAKELAMETFAAGSYVVKQGDPGESMYVIRAGEAVAELTGIGIVRDYERGGFFGEMALVTSEPRKASVRAVGELSVYVLARATFEKLVGNLAHSMEGLRRRFHVAAYTFGRRDYAKLFRHYDKNNSGYLEEPEFRAAVRKVRASAMMSKSPFVCCGDSGVA